MLVLVKSIIQSILSYIMSCFLLLSFICTQIEFMIANFYWGQDNNANEVHWINWRKLCASKYVGGRGF